MAMVMAGKYPLMNDRNRFGTGEAIATNSLYDIFRRNNTEKTV